MLKPPRHSISLLCALIALSPVAWAKDGGIYIWDGTSELAMLARVTDAVTHKAISGATVQAVRVGGRNTEPLTHEHSTAMPPPQKTARDV
jgi:hypothetical protein